MKKLLFWTVLALTSLVFIGRGWMAGIGGSIIGSQVSFIGQPEISGATVTGNSGYFDNLYTKQVNYDGYGDVEFFKNNIVANDITGNSIFINRNAPEGTDWFRFYIMENGEARISASDDIFYLGGNNYSYLGFDVSNSVAPRIFTNGYVTPLYFNSGDIYDFADIAVGASADGWSHFVYRRTSTLLNYIGMRVNQYGGAEINSDVPIFINPAGSLDVKAPFYVGQYASPANNFDFRIYGQNTATGVEKYVNHKLNAQGIYTISREDANVTSTDIQMPLKINSVYTLPTADGSANQVIKTDGAGTLTWTAQTGGGGGGSDANWQWDSGNTWLEPVTANTVVDVGTLYATTVSGNVVSGNTVKDGFVGNNLTNYATIQFTIASPDTLDELAMLPVWSNNSGKTFNVVSVNGWSDAIYNVVLKKMTNTGVYGGYLSDFSVATSGTGGVYYGTNTSVSSNTITGNTIIYFDSQSMTPDYIKITIQGYWS